MTVFSRFFAKTSIILYNSSMIKKRMMAQSRFDDAMLTRYNALHEDQQRRQLYWTMLRRARDDFGKTGNLYTDPYAFSHHLQKIYGLRPELDGSLNYTQSYTVIDEKKYLLFLLKYGS